MKIGIGVTTHNRYEVFKESYDQIIKYMPGNAKLVVVDDASDIPAKEATYRFESNVGIARAKNKCFELLDDCDHIFLFDDDTYPTNDEWWKPYIESNEPHLMYIFENFTTKAIGDCKVVYKDNVHTAYSHARGCMLYYDKRCLETVGGMNPEYGRWGNEHIDLSNRIHNAGLTSFRFADVAGSENLFYSADEHLAVTSTVGSSERSALLRKSQPLVNASRESDQYIEYREKINDISGQKNIVLTSYFTGVVDPQRSQAWDDNLVNDLAALALSCEDQRVELVCITDTKSQGLMEPATTVRRESAINPYFQRWLSYYQYLREHPEIDNVFCVDATDVTVLKNPFLYIEPGKIYCGDEPTNLGGPWMMQHNPEEPIRTFTRRNRSAPLLNAGVLGGSREDIMKIAQEIFTLYTDNLSKFHNDMGSFNFVLRTKYADRIEYGRKVTTEFKKYDEQNKESWICHK